MKIFLTLLLFLIFSCATKKVSETSSWSGAQRQESMEDTTNTEQQEQFRNQFPGQNRF